MMEDLLNFRTFKETLGTNGFRDIKVSENSIFCKAIICEHTIGLKGVLPETFPYEFPTIYIDEQSYANISPLPHIGSDFDICTFDKSTVIPNFKSPTQLLLASFVKAREIIRQGIAKENIEDFAEENGLFDLRKGGRPCTIILPESLTDFHYGTALSLSRGVILYVKDGSAAYCDVHAIADRNYFTNRNWLIIPAA